MLALLASPSLQLRYARLQTSPVLSSDLSLRMDLLFSYLGAEQMPPICRTGTRTRTRTPTQSRPEGPSAPLP